MIKDRTYKLIVLVIILFFAVTLFLSAKFLKNQITKASSPTLKTQENTNLDMEAWEKVKGRFVLR